MVLLNTGSTVPLPPAPPPPPPATPINVTLLLPSFRFLTSSTDWFQITKVEGKNQLEIYHTELTLVFQILFWSFLSEHQAVGEN